MADVLSGGRIRIGVGLANFPQEFELYGLNKKTQVSRFEECIDIVQRAWAGEEIDFHSKHFDIKGKITPLPIGARAVDRRDVRAGRPPGRALRLPVADRPAAQHRRDEVLGRPVPRRRRGIRHLGQARRSTCSATAGSPTRSTRSRRSGGRASAPSTGSTSSRSRAGSPSASRSSRESAEDDFKFDNHRIDRLIVGSPEDCIEQIQKFQDAIDMDYLIMSFRVAAARASRRSSSASAGSGPR